MPCHVCLGPLTLLWGDTSQLAPNRWTFGDEAGQRAGLCWVAAGAAQSYLDLKIQAQKVPVWVPLTNSYILLSVRPSCDLSESRPKKKIFGWLGTSRRLLSDKQKLEIYLNAFRQKNKTKASRDMGHINTAISSSSFMRAYAGEGWEEGKTTVSSSGRCFPIRNESNTLCERYPRDKLPAKRVKVEAHFSCPVYQWSWPGDISWASEGSALLQASPRVS